MHFFPMPSLSIYPLISQALSDLGVYVHVSIDVLEKYRGWQKLVTMAVSPFNSIYFNCL